jgi:hypothetical protein
MDFATANTILIVITGITLYMANPEPNQDALIMVISHISFGILFCLTEENE